MEIRVNVAQLQRFMVPGRAALEAKALANFQIFFQRDATVAEVQLSPAGFEGWADVNFTDEQRTAGWRNCAR